MNEIAAAAANAPRMIRNVNPSMDDVTLSFQDPFDQFVQIGVADLVLRAGRRRYRTIGAFGAAADRFLERAGRLALSLLGHVLEGRSNAFLLDAVAERAATFFQQLLRLRVVERRVGGEDSGGSPR